MSISNSSVLVEMNISVWTAQKTDRSATTKVASDNNASSDAGQYKKNLMAGTTVRKQIADYSASCRTWHNGRTLPWSDKGVRLLPTSMFFDYKKEANAKREEFHRMIDKFLHVYPVLVSQAETNLGDLFDPADYPDVNTVAGKFGFRLVFSPVPEAGDFRLDVGAGDLEELKAQYDVAYETRVTEAMATTWDKLHSALRGMSEKLTEPEGEKTKLFHSTFVTNAQELCGLLTHLNITKDPKLEAARRELEKVISSVDVEDIREDVSLRADMKGKVDGILKQFDW